jgi:hypothetical protein
LALLARLPAALCNLGRRKPVKRKLKNSLSSNALTWRRTGLPGLRLLMLKLTFLA